MNRSYGSPNAPRIECTNPRRNLWRIRWDFITDNEAGVTSYMEHQFSHKPSLSEVSEVIHQWVNKQVDEKILSGLRYDGALVWLSLENQFNYKAAYDLAVQTEGESLPVTLKFGTDDNPIYRTFDAFQDYADFYHAVINHINEQIAWGWQQKNIDLSPYDC